ncbi:MAG TPA: MraY family glycosyltransferase [Acidimicrobiales bacterium]|nr:MraY family glycosyltransferase [Acidimicrobiales bacterium]
MGSFLVVFVVAALVTFATGPLVKRLAVRVGAVVAPDDLRIHDEPTPTLGGAAMLLGFLAAMGVAWQLADFAPVFSGSTLPLGIVLAAIVIYGVGGIDDMREMSAPAKTAGMVLAGSILSIAGASIIFFRIPFLGFVSLSPDLSALITVIWVLGMCNAINFIDGLDGLAAGIVGIASIAFFLFAERLADPEVALLAVDNPGSLVAVATAGICIGFLPHNFHPASMFMGDGGALLLGVLMAAATISVGGNSSEDFSGQTFFFFAPLFIPLVVLGVPIFDTAFAIVRRATRRQGLATRDIGHLHHRLMDLGHGQRRSVVILWSWTALLSAMVLYPTYTGRDDSFVPLAIVGSLLLLFTYFLPRRRQARDAVVAETADAPVDGGTIAPS